MPAGTRRVKGGSLWLEVIIFAHVKAGACLAGESIVAHDESLRVIPPQAFQQGSHGCLLLRGAGVGRLSVRIQPSLVTDAYGVSVVVQGVCPHHFRRTAILYRPVTPHHIVIAAAVLPASVQMPLVDLFHRTGLMRHDRTAMDNQERNQSHGFSSC